MFESDRKKLIKTIVKLGQNNSAYKSLCCKFSGWRGWSGNDVSFKILGSQVKIFMFRIIFKWKHF